MQAYNYENCICSCAAVYKYAFEYVLSALGINIFLKEYCYETVIGIAIGMRWLEAHEHIKLSSLNLMRESFHCKII